jgi:quinol monooxygenase YgiN
MLSIKTKSALTTVLHFFTGPAASHAEFVDGWSHWVNAFLRKQPGFVAAALHVSLDGSRVVNYGQWQSRAAYDTVCASPQWPASWQWASTTDARFYEVAFRFGRLAPIQPGSNIATLINPLTVPPEHQHVLMHHLTQKIDPILRQLPGYISTNLHRSLDGTQVLNYAQWASPEAYQAAMKAPALVALLEQDRAKRVGSDPHLYSVAFSTAANAP